MRQQLNTKVQNLHNDVALFGRLYVANQYRKGDMLDFFSHENQLYHPSLSDQGILHDGDKQNILDCMTEMVISEGVFDC